MKTNRPGLEQHANNGRAAADVLRTLAGLHAFASEAYGKTSPEAKAAKAAADRVNIYRTRMDARVLMEQAPPRGSAAELDCMSCYYPGTSAKVKDTADKPRPRITPRPQWIA